jgi:hypothetical protein
MKEAAVRVLSSKRFFIPKGTTISLNYVKEWFDGVDRGLDDCTLVATLEAMDGKRRQKKSALRQLEELIVDGTVENEKQPVVWEQYGYQFKFLARKYLWNSQEIHVTANEALFLYRWLVLNEDTCKTQTYYLRNMRRRLGKEFMAEVTV